MTQGINLQTGDKGIAAVSGGKTGMSVHLQGGIVVTPPTNFWKLTTRQQVFLGTRFLENLGRILGGEFSVAG